MNISIFGLGYVGCISLGCLAKNGHQVIGVDTNAQKVAHINEGKPTVIEKNIDKIIAEHHREGLIRATSNAREAISFSDAAIICVGTPNGENGQLSLLYVDKVSEEIGEALTEKNDFFTILIRSTVPPGTNKRVIRIIERVSGKKHNKDFAVVSNPEFMREGAAVFDYFNPPYIVIASSSSRGLEVAKSIYERVDAPVEEMEIEGAELLKYINNSFHALKITFANEVGSIAKKLGIDSHRLMDVFVKDTKLNTSPAYLRPGFAYGGSCLPKDLKALTTLAHDFYLETPVLNAVSKSNEEQIKQAIRLIESKNKRSVGLVGISFKAGTDDMRFSPAVEVAEYLIGKGFQLKIFDSNVHLAKLTGTNKTFLETRLPHLSDLLVNDIQEMINEVDVICITHNEGALEEVVIPCEKWVIDFVRIPKLESLINYHGLSW